MNTPRMAAPNALRTQPRHQLLSADTVTLRSADRRRASLALSLTFRLSGKSGQQAARILEKHESTISRYADGEHDSPFSRLREDLRKMCAAGVYPVPVLVDLVSELWGSAVKDWTLDELLRRKRELHRDEQKAQAAVDCWQMDDLEGTPSECENEVDAALLEQIARTVELYAIRQEIRLRQRR